MMWQILRTDIDTGLTEKYRVMHSLDEETVKRFCKRFNGFATRHEFSNHYSYQKVVE